MLCFCPGVWAEAKTYYFYPDGTAMPTELKNKNRVYYTFDAETGTIQNTAFGYDQTTSNPPYITELTIPDKIDGAEVKVLKPIEYLHNLETVNLPKYLESMPDEHTFGQSKNGDIPTLKKVVFQFNEHNLGLANRNCKVADGAFKGCTALLTADDGEVVFTNSNYGTTYSICPKTQVMRVVSVSNLSSSNGILGSYTLNDEVKATSCQLGGVFKNNTSVTTLVIDDGTLVFGDGEFEGCTNLQNLVLPKSFDMARYPDGSASCADLIKGCSNLKHIFVFYCGVPYDIACDNGTYTATIDCKDYADASLKNSVNRASQAEGKLTFMPSFNFAKGYTATLAAIDDDAFAGNTNITSVEIYSLQTYSNSISSVGANAFKGCTGMKEFKLTNSHADGIVYGASCFEGCTGLTQLDLRARSIVADKTTGMKLPAGFLKGCTNISRLSFGSEIKESEIADDALPSIDGKLSTVDFVKVNGTSVAKYTWFRDLECQLPGGTSFKGQQEFESKSGSHVALLGLAYAETDFITQTQTYLGDKVFFYGKGKIGGELQTICDWGFTGDKHIKGISIPASVVRIGDNCFDTDVLEKLRIDNKSGVRYELTRPEGATNSKEMAAEYYADGADAPEEWAISTAHSISNVNYFVTSLADDFGKKSTAVKRFSIVYDKLPKTFNQTMAIGKNAFNGCTALQRIDFGKYVTAIGENAFNGCTAMQSLVIDWPNLKTVGDGAFGGCDNLKTFVYDFNKIDADTKTKGDAYDKIICNVHGENAEITDDIKFYIVYSKVLDQDKVAQMAKSSNYQFYHASDYRYLPIQNSYDGSAPDTGYGTICLPYDIDYGKSYNLGGVYKAQLNADGTAVNLEYIQSYTDIKAGVPYIFQSKKKPYLGSDENNLVVFASNNEYKYVSAPVSSDDNILTGTFDKVAAEDGDYIMQSDNNFHLVDKSVYAPNIGAYRAYIKASSLTASTSVAALLSLNIGGSVTGIGGINASGNDDADAADKKIYTIDGQRVLAPVKGQIYIIGGKKRVY